MSYRIPLSKPDMGSDERSLLMDAFDTGSLDAGGPQVEGFEADMASYLTHQVHPVALSSSAAALHLAMLLADVGRGDEVLCPTLSPRATIDAITAVGAVPAFVDVEPDTWTIDPDRAVAELHARRSAAVVTLDLLGQCADHRPIVHAARELDVPVIEDASHALGATHESQPAGTMGTYGIFSFDPEQMITTSGGGMLLIGDPAKAAHARTLAGAGIPTDDDLEQPEAGLGLQLSDLLAAVGRAQLRGLDAKVARRREIHARYHQLLAEVPGLRFQAELPRTRSARWLTAVTVDPAVAKADRDTVLHRLHDAGIEARGLDELLQIRPALDASPRGGHVAEQLSERGLCLPSGTTLTDEDIDEVAAVVTRALT